MIYERPVRFDDVDAAGIVFFPRYLEYAFEAMDALLAAVPGGHASLVRGRRIGVPTVHVECDYRAPLTYGDVARIDVRVVKIGRTSVTFHYSFSSQGRDVATITQVVALTDITNMRAIPIPPDVRAILEKNG